MKSIVFPQVDHVPNVIKDKVMSHIASDPTYKRSLIKKIRLSKIMMPAFVMGFLFVGVFSFLLFSFDGNTEQQVSVITSEDTHLIEQKLGEIDQILDDLDRI